MKFVISGAFQPPRDLIPIAQAAEESGFEAISFLCRGALRSCAWLAPADSGG
jgi:hypothetical protein